MTRGIFISFEGSEGCGKSTQIQRLAKRLQDLGHSPLLTREPGGTPVGEQIRHLLQFDDAGKSMVPEAELLLFTASRAQLTRQVIEPALQQGRCVVADRFLDSTTVYQGVARAIPQESVELINRFAVGSTLPNITFVLDLDCATARARLLRRPRPVGAQDRMEQQPPEFYEAVRHGYLELAKTHPDRIRVIDASPSADAIEAEIWSQIAPLLARAIDPAATPLS